MRGSKIRPFLLLGAAALVVTILVLVSSTPEDRERKNAAPLVRVIVAEPTTHQFTVKAYGSVSPRTESELIPQVSGEVLWISPSMVAGGFFESGDILARVDSADYRVDRETARASVARAESEFHRAEKELGRQRRLKDRSVASESRIDDAENGFHVAEASLLEARARLERATRDLARTELKAPYRGRVRSKKVDVGQFVTRGSPIATLYAVDFAEIRLPVPDRELAFLDVPLVPSGLSAGRSAANDPDNPDQGGSPVRLTAEFAGRVHHWTGTLVRTEAELDPRTRMVHLVARVTDPYGLAPVGLAGSGQTNGGLTGSGEAAFGLAGDGHSGGLAEAHSGSTEAGMTDGLTATWESGSAAPLAVGLFVEAIIEGQSIKRAYVIPRDALRDGNRVYVVDSEQKIQFRDVKVVRTERENIIVSRGLKSGDRICITPLQAAINGMRVRVYDSDTGESDNGSVSDSIDPSLDSSSEHQGLAERPTPPAETLQ